MKVTMDRVGRIVIPKPLRDELGLVADAEFDLVVEGTGIRLDPIGRRERGIVDHDGWPVLAPAPGVVLSDADVRDLRDADRR